MMLAVLWGVCYYITGITITIMMTPLFSSFFTTTVDAIVVFARRCLAITRHWHPIPPEHEDKH